MDIKFTKSEAENIRSIFSQFETIEDKDSSLKDNLTKFYMQQREGVTPAEAERVVDSIERGVEDFNKELSEALKDESVDFVGKLITAADGLSKEKQYELYVNVYATLMALSVDNFSKEEGRQIEDVETLAKKYAVTGEVTDEQIDEIINKIDEALKDNTFCLTTSETLKQIGEKADNLGNLSEIARGAEEDMRVKEATALATYIAYQNGEIESLAGKEITPEAIAVAAAAGIEQARSFQLFVDGKINKDALIHILKVIGGLALVISLSFVVGNIVTAGTIITMAVLVDIIGTSLAGMFIAITITFAIGLALLYEGTNVIEKGMEIGSEMFDNFVSFLRETAWPKIKEAAGKAISFIKQKKEEHTVNEATVDENGEVVLQNA